MEFRDTMVGVRDIFDTIYDIHPVYRGNSVMFKPGHEYVFMFFFLKKNS